MWDAIVIGSGIGGLAAAAALARRGRRVLVLEQHRVPGGLTQTFSRGDWTFATGVHYIGGVGPHPGPEGQFGRLLHWLTDGELAFAECANPYDIVQVPGFSFGIPHPESAYREALLERFPGHEDEIAHWFSACDAARAGAGTLFALHALPRWMGRALRWLRGSEVQRWSQRTLADELSRIRHPHLRAVLGARWGDHGAPPAVAPFVEHAMVTGGFNGGAYYPVGGPARFAQTLLPRVIAAGGDVRLQHDVVRIVVEDGHVRGVLARHEGRLVREDAPLVISAMGVANTVTRLEPGTAEGWQQRVGALEPSVSYLSLFLGFEGDIGALGASSANHWIYETEDIGRLWRKPAAEDAPGLYVSFPSMKDPQHQGKPTAEVVALVDPAAFAPWLHGPVDERTEDYLALKSCIEERLLAQFLRHFPSFRPLLRFHELSTPVTQRQYVRAPEGAMYGVEMSAERLTSPALHVRTPLPGLLLAGQDVISPGVMGAFMGGLLAAATAEPALWAQLRA